MPKRTRITALEKDILKLLEEAGAESIGTILNTISGRQPDLSHQEVLMNTTNALRKLSRLGLIEMGDSTLTNILKSVDWDDVAKCWEIIITGKLPVIVLTKNGKSFLIE